VTEEWYLSHVGTDKFRINKKSLDYFDGSRCTWCRNPNGTADHPAKFRRNPGEIPA
jgi:hypothetical protein